MSIEKRAIILGCGPAALLAAHQLNRDHGFANVNIEFKTLHKEPSPIGGAQYLHLPMLDEDAPPDALIEFIKVGKPDVYAEKVYGSPHVPTSWGEYGNVQKAWRLQANYTTLFSRFRHMIEGGWRATPTSVEQLLAEEPDAETLILSSVPASHLCKRPDLHDFPRANILIRKEEPSFLPTDNVVIYNGKTEDKWYRACKLFGECWTEYSHYDAPAGKPGYITGFKPLGTACNCFPEIHRIGRFGTWDRKVLLTDVTGQVDEAVLRTQTGRVSA
jgi:hypothetical protein